MKLLNSTSLCDKRLLSMLVDVAHGWPHDSLEIRVRYSRGRDFSGVCNYRAKRICINLGRHLRFPYDVKTYLARAQSTARVWWREIYCLRVGNAYELTLFIFLHEFFHWLVRLARRNTRQKEAMCDRFAARALVDRYGGTVFDPQGRVVRRSEWDFQDLEGFVGAARSVAIVAHPPRRAACGPTPAEEFSVDDNELLPFPRNPGTGGEGREPWRGEI